MLSGYLRLYRVTRREMLRPFFASFSFLLYSASSSSKRRYAFLYRRITYIDLSVAAKTHVNNKRAI